jgi:3-deoxy-D-manno-octulosonic acid (KDO) 8-phosphate synthase
LSAEIAAEYVDILQIPAFLSCQTELLEAAAQTGKIINIKGPVPFPEDMIHQIKRRLQAIKNHGYRAGNYLWLSKPCGRYASCWL